MDIVKQTLEKQLQLLSERSENCDSLDDLVQINQAICNTVQSVLLLEQITRYGRGGRTSKNRSFEPACLDQNA